VRVLLPVAASREESVDDRRRGIARASTPVNRSSAKATEVAKEVDMRISNRPSKEKERKEEGPGPKESKKVMTKRKRMVRPTTRQRRF
jgi:hypothetical protein